VIYSEDVEHIFGKRPWVSRSEEILEQQGIKEKSPTGDESNSTKPEAEETKKEKEVETDK
jgi:cell division protease FtsH